MRQDLKYLTEKLMAEDKNIGIKAESKIKDLQDSLMDISEIEENVSLDFSTDGWYSVDKILKNETTYKNMTINVSEGDKYNITGYTGGDVRLYVLFDSSNNIVGMYPDATVKDIAVWTEVSTSVIIPSGVTKMILSTPNSKKNMWIIKKVSELLTAKYEEKIKLLNEEITILRNRNTSLSEMILEDQLKNDFAWKDFSGTKYATFTFDDTLTDIDVIEDLFESKGVPCCFATVYTRLDNKCTNGETCREVLQRAVENGGEVLSHWLSPLTSDSTDEDFVQTYVTTKDELEKNGFKVNGVILSGGIGQETQDFEKGIKICRPLYKYGDLIATGHTDVEQFYNYRKFLDLGLSDVQTYVDAYLTGDEQGRSHWMNFASHGTKDTSIDVIGQIIDYLIAKDVKIVTWKTIYDTFKTSKLEKRIDSL